MPENDPPRRADELSADARSLFSYDVPQSIVYSGQSLIELRLDPEDFIASAGHPEGPDA